MKAQDEPEVMASQHDFMLAEMTDMAIDFQEENNFKRVLALKVAKES